jgi:D-alanyl-D-alanine carboxypeptidase/D-alanyl-D-alanine-endopeptidase (penicillin-binding protein 4)
VLPVRESRRHRARSPLAVRALPSSPRVHLIPRRALILAVVLALAGAACLAVAVHSDAEPAAAIPASPTSALATAVWSPRRTPALFVAAASAAALQRALPGLVAPYDGCVAVAGPDGSIAQLDDRVGLAGASTQKLLVGAAALAVMGPDHRFTTNAVTDAPLNDGVLEGDLVVVGGGDPMLTTADTPRTPQVPVTHLADLADAIVAAGVRRIDGALVADDSRYDRDRAVAAWTAADDPGADIGALGALVLDGGHGPDGLASSDPALDTVDALATLLETRGVDIAGGTSDPARAAPANARDLARVTSAPLADIVGEMLTDSNNETAELLTREIGVRRARNGTTEAGAHAIPAVLGGLGVPVDGVDLHDGSGLAHANRLTCRALLGVLVLGARPRLHAILDGLAVAGRTGTLATRFLGTPLVDRLRAKTGHITGVVGLAGLVTPGARFAFVANGDFSTDDGARLQDEVGGAIGSYLDAPGPPGLVPAPRPG